MYYQNQTFFCISMNHKKRKLNSFCGQVKSPGFDANFILFIATLRTLPAID